MGCLRPKGSSGWLLWVAACCAVLQWRCGDVSDLGCLNSGGIISELGAIREVHLYEITSSGYVLTLAHSPAHIFVGRDDVRVCWVRNLLCSGTDAESSTDCPEEYRETISLLRAVSRNKAEALGIVPGFLPNARSYAPLSVSGPFTLLVSEVGDTVDVLRLTMPERLGLLMALREALSSMVMRIDSSGRPFWQGGSNSRLRVLPRPPARDSLPVFLTRPTVSALELMPFLTEVADTSYEASGTSVSERVFLVNWEDVCGEVLTEECKALLLGSMSTWAQDMYHVRSCDAQSNTLNRNRIKLSPSAVRIVAAYADQLCFGMRSDVDSLLVDGGNMFVMGDVAFIGADDKVRFLKRPEWRRSLSITADHEIDHQLKVNIFGRAEGKHLIWVGDRDPALASDAFGAAQPMYHIDVFFHPLGQLSTGGTFAYILAIPDEIYQQEAEWGGRVKRSHFNELRSRLETARARLDASLRSIGFEPDAIIVPMPIEVFNTEEFNPGLHGRFLCFANGLSENSMGRVTFFMPVYPSSAGYRFQSVRYEDAKSAAIRAIEAKGVTVKEVSGHYGTNDALRCNVKVLRRDRP